MDVRRPEVRAELERVTTDPNSGFPMWTDGEFKLLMTMYTDPHRARLARSAARYLGKQDLGNIRRPLSIIKAGHVPEIFRGEHAEFEYEGVSKEVYDHLVTYTTRDMRVAGGNRALKSHDFAMPSDPMKDPSLVQSIVAVSFENYNYLLAQGETRQVARNAMPVSARMNTFTYQWNFLTLGQALFSQRIWDTGAQGNTVRVARGMWALCFNTDPELWSTMYDFYGTPMIEWKEIRSTLRKRGLTAEQLIAMLKSTDPENTSAEDALIALFGKRTSMW